MEGSILLVSTHRSVLPGAGPRVPGGCPVAVAGRAVAWLGCSVARLRGAVTVAAAGAGEQVDSGDGAKQRHQHCNKGIVMSLILRLSNIIYTFMNIIQIGRHKDSVGAISNSSIRNRTSNTEIGRVLFQCYKSYFR